MTDVTTTGRGNQGGASLGEMIDARYSRRTALRGGASAAAFAVFAPTVLAACGGDDDSSGTGSSPVVTAVGSVATTTSGNRVTITATATDDGTVTSTSFVQVSGPPISLSAITGLTTSFIAPAVLSPTIIAIRFTATDNDGNTTSADTNVTVNIAALGFTAVARNRLDVVTVPAGYTASVLYRTGDPITAAAGAYRNDGTDTDFASRAGDQHDGLYWFGLEAAGTGPDVSNSTRGLLLMNHEDITQAYLHPAGPTNVGGARPEAEVLKEIEAHGVSIVEVTQATGGAWGYVQASALNRRVTPNTPVSFSGPVRGTSLLQTAYSPAGTDGRGTINNCATGYTAWSTSLTTEENWAEYFRRPTSADNARRTAKEVAALTRYNVTSATGKYGWATVTAADPANTSYRRWDAQATGGGAGSDFRNEPNQFGWVVEVDPYDKAVAPRKRTALGRMNHEGCWPSPFLVGRKPAIYMSDGGENEYFYKFVSATAWASADAANANRISIGDKYLDTGTLYVAQFKADGTGTWLPLTFGTAPLTAANATYPFADQADVLTHARLAGDALAATRLDRPGWTSVSPTTGEIYLSLTGSGTRTNANTDAVNPRSYQDPPSAAFGNRNGHIVRLREAAETSEATTFTWDIFLFGAGADLDPTNINLSALDATNDFSGPDGLAFGRPSNAAGLGSPLMWVQTDDVAYTDATNNQMLAAIPGRVGDGGTTAVRTITNRDAAGGTTTVQTRIGQAPGAALKRFLVGPVECEVTGVDSTPDGRTVFVNIQHPGETGSAAAPTSNWPASQTAPAPGSRPRSATVVIQRTDGGVVGL